MSKNTCPSPTEDALAEHPSRDNTGRCSADQLLRSLGFRILSRPAKGPTLWLFGQRKRVYTEAEAHSRVAQALKRRRSRDD